jgi:hypothetical protein
MDSAGLGAHTKHPHLTYAPGLKYLYFQGVWFLWWVQEKVQCQAVEDFHRFV